MEPKETIEEDVLEFKKAWRTFIECIYEELHVYKIISWISNILWNGRKE